MDTENFFAKILPRTGLKVLAELVPFTGDDGKTREGWRYKTFNSFEDMAEAAHMFDKQGRTVYHACNSFGDWYDDNGKKRIRTQENVVACRSLYDDIDVGKEGCYQTVDDAVAAVHDFVAHYGIPSPMIIGSGGGIHLYWPADDDQDPKVWLEAAANKRRLTAEFGLKVDRAVDLDSARVLRPVGMHNRKRATPVQVTVLEVGSV